MKKKEEMVLALAKEIRTRKNEAINELIETIYFGGGTPSVLQVSELKFLIDTVYENFQVSKNVEITLEANPDDLTQLSLQAQSISIFENYRAIGINRLSIGIQSFFEDDLKLMNRAHNSVEATKCLEVATKYFKNISIDLIYGVPNMSNQKWKQNIETALSFGIPHISSYALTVEPKTALKKLIQTGKIAAPRDEVAAEHFGILVEMLEASGFIHYELSNFGKEDYFSKNNSAYWLGKKYIGIGPSAHSYNGVSRSWNISNNSIYLKSIQENKLPNELEILSNTDRYNEYVMTGLRTIWGVSLATIEQDFGMDYLNDFHKQTRKYLDDDLLFIENGILKPTKKGKFLTDGIASDLFILK
jgi:oxygen-independent coproporphyrinogen-3 oxidase